MGKLKNILLLTILVFLASYTYGQTSTLTLPPISYHKTAIKHNLFSIHASSLIASHYSAMQKTHAFGSYVHDPAFFCQMEQKSVNRLGVMVKVHAGDYDTYSKKH